MMKNSKILISINNLNEIEKYKKIGITNFLFALHEYSIGYPEFTIEELKNLDVNVYLNINIIMDTAKINSFKEIIPNLTFAKGILFEDVGVYNILKDSEIPLIWNQAHFAINSVSINSWLKRVSSAVLANDLTKEEINFILDKIDKPLILPIFGFNMAMYSRRYLLGNYNRYHGYKMMNKSYLKINDANEFIAEEAENGTVLFYRKPFNYFAFLDEFDDNKLLLYYFDATKIAFEEYQNILNNTYTDSEEKFLNKKTIYKLEV